MFSIFNCNMPKKIRLHYNIIMNTIDSSNISYHETSITLKRPQGDTKPKGGKRRAVSLLHTDTWSSHGIFREENSLVPNLVGMHTCCLFVPAYLESGLFSRWTARGTKVNPRVWRRPKLMDEGEESEVLNLETAETSPSMDSFSTSINEPSSLLWVACLRCLCFLDGRAFFKNSNEVGNLCLSTRCCCRLL